MKLFFWAPHSQIAAFWTQERMAPSCFYSVLFFLRVLRHCGLSKTSARFSFTLLSQWVAWRHRATPAASGEPHPLCPAAMGTAGCEGTWSRLKGETQRGKLSHIGLWHKYLQLLDSGCQQKTLPPQGALPPSTRAGSRCLTPQEPWLIHEVWWCCWEKEH